MMGTLNTAQMNQLMSSEMIGRIGCQHVRQAAQVVVHQHHMVSESSRPHGSAIPAAHPGAVVYGIQVSEMTGRYEKT